MIRFINPLKSQRRMKRNDITIEKLLQRPVLRIPRLTTQRWVIQHWNHAQRTHLLFHPAAHITHTYNTYRFTLKLYFVFLTNRKKRCDHVLSHAVRIRTGRRGKTNIISLKIIYIDMLIPNRRSTNKLKPTAT